MAGPAARKKDQEMAARLKADPSMCERFTGICAVCGKLIRNVAMLNHISAHARGASD